MNNFNCDFNIVLFDFIIVYYLSPTKSIKICNFKLYR